jgi:MerR family transcriptional regulator, light-induced transcriptional regulator
MLNEACRETSEPLAPVDEMNESRPDSTTPDSQYASTTEVAAALGVSVTTVKRWVDGRILPAHRTPGGHRKVLTADVVRLVRESHFPRADLTRLYGAEPPPLPADSAELCATLTAAVDAGDADRVRELIVGGYRAGLSVEELADRVISPAFVHVGHEWQAGRMGVLAEHRLTQAAVSAVYELRGMLRAPGGPDRPVAVGGAPEHDHYLLATLLAQLTLADGGWDAINLGPHTPTGAFRSAVEDLRPELVWVSVSHLAEPARFVTEFNDLCQFCAANGVAVAVGGRGLTAELRAKLTYTAFGDGLTQLLAFARSLHHHHASKRKRG